MRRATEVREERMERLMQPGAELNKMEIVLKEKTRRVNFTLTDILSQIGRLPTHFNMILLSFFRL